MLYSRPGCELCEEMRSDLAALPSAVAIPVEVIEVDSSPLLRARYGHKIPVLLYAGELVCHGRLDVDEVDKALAFHR